MKEVSIKEFSRNPSQWLGEEDLHITKRGEGAWIVSKYVPREIQGEIKGKLPESTYLDKATKEQVNINAWRDKVGALDSPGYAVYDKNSVYA